MTLLYGVYTFIGEMKMDNFDIECPGCHSNIHVPFFRELEAKAIEKADLLEISARDKLEGFHHASLWELIKFWGRNRWI